MRFHESRGRWTLLDGGGAPDAAHGGATLSALHLMQHRGLARSLVELGLEIVHEARGPMRLWEFAARLRLRLGMPHVPAGELCDAVKTALDRIEDPRLRVLAPSTPGVGYVYDDHDPDSRPIRSSR
jgi:hypothetical protein